MPEPESTELPFSLALYLAERVAAYRSALLERDIPNELAAVLVRDWHQAELRKQYPDPDRDYSRLPGIKQSN
jgi:hypothetical protein